MNQCKFALFLSFLCFRREVIGPYGKRSLLLGIMSRGGSRGEAGGGGGRPNLYLDQTEARRAKNIFLETRPILYLTVWMTTPPLPLSEGVDPSHMSVQFVYLPAVGYT